MSNAERPDPPQPGTPRREGDRPVVPEELWDNACTFVSMFWRAVKLGQEMEREAALEREAAAPVEEEEANGE